LLFCSLQFFPIFSIFLILISQPTLLHISQGKIDVNDKEESIHLYKGKLQSENCNNKIREKDVEKAPEN